jgi:two-component system, cell cycle sensor histidine kinase and response regulator CckA
MSKPVVLLVEDDAIARMVFKKIISRLEYQFYEAPNGQEALELINQHGEISHIFLDLNMPVLDGYGFLYYLNSGRRHDDINIYITSVSDEDEFLTTTQQRNIDVNNVKGYNRKPFDMAQLIASINATDTAEA